MEWRFVWSRGDEHETGRALSREMLRLYRDKAREKRDVPPDIGTVFIGNNGKPMTNGCYFNISHSHGLVACAFAPFPVGPSFYAFYRLLNANLCGATRISSAFGP